MGLFSSKDSKKSYDIAPVVSDKDFSFKKSPRPLPEVKLPAVIITPETPVDNLEDIKSPISETAAKPVTTSLIVENAIEAQAEKPTEANQTPVTTSLIVENATDVQPEKPAQPLEPRIPTWVNENNFKPFLIDTYPDFEEILSFHAKPALAAGENYATLMLRVKVTIKLKDATTKDLSYMLKVAHDNKEMMDMLQHMNFFDVENAVYNEVIPEMEEMYRQAGLDVHFGAKAYRMGPEAPGAYYVLLEDLSLRHYKNANRLESLDMDHAELVLRKLALFHAASASRVEAKGEYSATLTPDMDNPVARGMMQQMFGSFKKPFLDNIHRFENGEKYAASMEIFFDNLIEEFIYSRKAHSGYFNVLNHGDSWSNNILFKYDANGKVEDLIFVDFQNTNYSSPAQDLFYFMISSLQVDIKVAKYEYFINYYHKHLEENLRLLKYPEEKIPSLRELHKQLIAFGSWATITAFMTMGVVLLDPHNDAKFENFLSEHQEGMDFKNLLFSNPRYIKHINEVLPWLYNHGFMEPRYIADNKIASADKLSVTSPADETAKVTAKCSYPEWVNESYFENIIRSDCENYQKILKFNVSPATNAGDNYSSIMLKIDIDVELKDNSQRNLSYMLKVPPNGEQAQRLIAFMNSFTKEIKAYKDIVPQLEKVYKDQCNLEVVFGPKSYKPSKDQECDTLILENLKVKGFKNCDRLKGLDMKHTLAALRKLAQFHAASAFLFEQQGHYDKVFEQSVYREEIKQVREPMFKEFYDIYLECVKEYQGNEEYYDSLKTLLDNGYDNMTKTFTIDFNKFNVLNHGDFWVNNIMFQYNENGDIDNTYFVDYQLCQYGSPVYDLYYFLLSSTKFELKLDSFEYFIRYYHENLEANLKSLKYSKAIPTLKELHMELLEKSGFAIYAATGVMAAVLLEPSENANLENMVKEGDSGKKFKKNMYLATLYRSHAEAVLPWMYRRGLFDSKLSIATTVAPTTPSGEKMKEAHIPSWIDAKHFEDIVKSDVENFDKILSVNASSATKSGDNYASTLLRVKVEVSLTDGSTITKSYIHKMPVESEEEKGMFALMNLYEKEGIMYSKYIPEYEKLFAQHGKKLEFGPRYYKFYSKDTKEDLILLEDLGHRGFKCIDRRQGLDMAHTKCVLERMAQFHAASVKYMELNGPYPEAFQKGVYTEETRDLFKSMDTSVFYEYFKQFENHEEYIDKVPSLLANGVDYNIRMSKVDPMEFNVLNHGDSWINNIMFKHDETGNIEETYYIDYQVCKYGTPAQDLWYFLMSSTQLDIKVEHFDYFIRYYHENLLENLKLLEYQGQVPTLNELHQIMLKYGFLGYNTTIGTTAICLLDSNENANLTNFMAATPEGKRFRDSIFLNEKYKANAAIVYPWLARRGCLDYRQTDSKVSQGDSKRDVQLTAFCWALKLSPIEGFKVGKGDSKEDSKWNNANMKALFNTAFANQPNEKKSSICNSVYFISLSFHAPNIVFQRSLNCIIISCFLLNYPWTFAISLNSQISIIMLNKLHTSMQERFPPLKYETHGIFINMDIKENNNQLKRKCIYPEWIKADIFENALKKAEPEFKQILEFKINYALPPGENYLTIMLKPEFVIELNDKSSKTLSFMMKIGYDTEYYREMLKPYNAFHVETEMYRDVIPELEKIFYNAGLEVKFGPKPYNLPTDELYILLENLKPLGYRNANRLEGFDMKHSKCVLKKLAQWHAASAVRVATKGRYSDQIHWGYIKRENYHIVNGMYENISKILLECIRDYTNSNIYYDKVEKLQSQVTDEIFKTLDDNGDENTFQVLNHGDIWSNNIMFKYKDDDDDGSGDIVETYFVDYQTPRYTSPAPDLLYFIMSSCQYDIKLKKFDYMLAYYHNHLVEYLRILNYPKKVPTLKDIHYMVYKHGIWGYASSIIVLAVALCDTCNKADLDNFIGASSDASEFRKQMYSNPRYRKHMEAILPWLLNRGLLDF
ncbi:uncharacterized protein LOC142222514 [Haematobia irritans]|uniref:uncharacterized protein LOC142222514 n=1 Tax=Haematobia irritans TaxID=7368 RepID=UPI003F4F5166